MPATAVQEKEHAFIISRGFAYLHMQELNFPSFQFRFKNKENTIHIFDVIRKKFVVLTPEEWVRQHCIQLLIQEKGYPASLLQVERRIVLNGLNRRYDLVAFTPDGNVLMAVECKQPGVLITQDTFDQLSRYNHVLQAPVLWITNGLTHCIAAVNRKEGKYDFLQDIPAYIR